MILCLLLLILPPAASATTLTSTTTETSPGNYTTSLFLTTTDVLSSIDITSNTPLSTVLPGDFFTGISLTLSLSSSPTTLTLIGSPTSGNSTLLSFSTTSPPTLTFELFNDWTNTTLLHNTTFLFQPYIAPPSPRTIRNIQTQNYLTSYSNGSYGTYTTHDLSLIVTDGAGTFLAAIVENIDLIVLGLVLLLGISTVAYLNHK